MTVSESEKKSLQIRPVSSIKDNGLTCLTCAPATAPAPQQSFIYFDWLLSWGQELAIVPAERNGQEKKLEPDSCLGALLILINPSPDTVANQNTWQRQRAILSPTVLNKVRPNECTTTIAYTLPNEQRVIGRKMQRTTECSLPTSRTLTRAMHIESEAGGIFTLSIDIQSLFFPRQPPQRLLWNKMEDKCPPHSGPETIRHRSRPVDV